jgi:uncharacterized protein (DUF58 family)
MLWPSLEAASLSAMTSLKHRLALRWQSFVDRRSPPQDRLTLHHRNLYIVPSRAGWTFALVSLILLLAAINEQLNLGHALAFLLGGVGFSTMARSHGNLQGLALTLRSGERVHAGDCLALQVVISGSSARQSAHGLQLSTGTSDTPVWAEVSPGGESVAVVSLPCPLRGEQQLPRLKVLSRYPLGLFTVWGHWRPAQTVLVWPAPERPCPPWPLGAAEGDQRPQGAPSAETPDALREWQRGDSLRQVAWKKSALTMFNGGSPVVRIGQAQTARQCTLDWTHTQGLATEARLSRLAAWLIQAQEEADRTGMAYGLSLPGTQIEPSQGVAHLHQCLDALARWPR